MGAARFRILKFSNRPVWLIAFSQIALTKLKLEILFANVFSFELLVTEIFLLDIHGSDNCGIFECT